MKYKSTRGGVKNLPFKDAVMMGLAEDGGLVIPDYIPLLNLEKMREYSLKGYEELAFHIMRHFTDDIEDSLLREIINRSYSNFDVKEIVPVKKINDFFIAEIFHGPTYAFKDVALQFLGNLFEHILKERSEKMNVLAATSGDTGSAAIYGLKGKDNLNIFIMHPMGKVSSVQEAQMTSVMESNVFNLAVNGNFDDCQYIAKELFSDLDFKKDYRLGAVNSINWARILAQIVYYFYAYFKVSESYDCSGDSLRFAVPTGNFGNILAAYYAKLMGLPVDKLILATNENNILHRFISSGDYSIRSVVQTYSPSMDIQLSSNLERYLYYLFNEDSELLKSKMSELRKYNKLSFTHEQLKQIQKDFVSRKTTNEETIKTIKNIYERYSYLIDPHTACGVNALNTESSAKDCINICIATAHPAKFPEAVYKAVKKYPEKPANITKLDNLEKRYYKIENDTEAVKSFIVDTLGENNKNLSQ